jgi:type II secretory pathway pseudopilin PulG
VTRRNSILLVAVAVVAVIAAYWMLVLTPKREEAAKLDKQITVKQTALASAEAEVADYENARSNYRANYSMVARLGKAVPVDDDVRSLMVQINAAAGHSGVDFRTINIAGSGAAAATAPSGTAPGATTTAAPPPGATSVGTAGFSTMPFSFNFKGSFFELGRFFNRIDRFVAVRNGSLDVTGRLLLLNSITLTPDATKGFPMLSADVSANSYLLPPTEGLTAGATAAGPAGSGTTAAPATPAPSTPATTTTATISGATR